MRPCQRDASSEKTCAIGRLASWCSCGKTSLPNINIIKESEPEEFENNEAGHQIETKDLEDKFMSTLLEFPDKKLGVNQTEQFLRESSPLKHFDLSVFSNDTIKDLYCISNLHSNSF